MGVQGEGYIGERSERKGESRGLSMMLVKKNSRVLMCFTDPEFSRVIAININILQFILIPNIRGIPNIGYSKI